VVDWDGEAGEFVTKRVRTVTPPEARAARNEARVEARSERKRELRELRLSALAEPRTRGGTSLEAEFRGGARPAWRDRSDAAVF
jgi:hypothetical protein